MHKLVIGNKLYSSWSLRPWLLMKILGIPFGETVIPLYEPGSKAAILALSPSGKVPTLIDGDVVVWESLAIMEYLADRHGELGVWPKGRAARAHARSVATEMHAGFMALRQACSMNLGKRYAATDRGEAVANDVARITAIFREARSRFGAGGPFLYGPFTAADAMYAPVVTRFETYGIVVDPVSRAYMNAVLGLPAYQEWHRGALAETWTIPHTEVR
ncbi:MAG: glutathione S-transferase family protein [Alphaproteobacteria bacterium]|nr:glutathione S-transferase family protein [Alphaproteobacteria bacterium]